MNKKVVVFLGLCLIACMASLMEDAYSKPFIRGIVEGWSGNGETITINGGNFGTKKPATPVIWDNLDSGEPSSNWTQVENTIEIYSGSGQLNHSRYCFRFDKSKDSGFTIQKNIEITDKLYLFVKRRYDYDVRPDNHKFFSIWQPGFKNSILWNYNWGNSYQMRNSHCAPNIDPLQREPNYVIKLGSKNFPAVGQWQTEEFFVQVESGIRRYDGVMGYRLNNIQHRSWAANRAMFCEEYNQLLSNVFVDNYSDHLRNNPKPNDFIWVDDVYIDTSWARVMLGNKPNYDACTDIEIQVPVKWSSNFITITLNRGALSPCNTYYLYVFDENGNVNTDGFPVYIVTSSGEKPCPPKGLKISE